VKFAGKLGSGHTCRVGDVVRAVDFGQLKGDVCGWTMGRSERRGTEVPDRSVIDGPWPPAWQLAPLSYRYTHAY